MKYRSRLFLIVLLCTWVMLAATTLACCATLGGDDRVDITLVNDTPDRITMRAKMGPFFRVIVLEPYQTWEGWGLKSFVGDEVRIEVLKGE